MAAAAQPLKHKAPAEGIVEIRPYNPKKVFGHAGGMAPVFTYKRQKVESWAGISGLLEIPGMGIVLHMDNPAHKDFFEVVMNSDQWAGVVSPQENPREGKARYYILNKHADAQAYLAARERKDEADAEIKNLTSADLKIYSLMFKIPGDNEVIRAGLYKMAEKEKGRADLLAKFKSKDRSAYEMIAKAEGSGDINTKKGLYHNQSDVYFLNGDTLGVGIELVVSKMAKDDVLFRAIKALAS